MQPNELAAAKINATLKILEWSKDDIEPGIDGAPEKAHIALAEAFREIFEILGQAIEDKPQARGGSESDATPIGGEGLTS
jgi:hypothetical protein